MTHLAAAALAAGALATCGAPPRSNVLLIVIDTLRADHLGAYGYARPTSPRLDALASSGVRFANARATSSWTLPSVASILTGLYPAAHGVELNTSSIASDLPTMPEAFRGAGYVTGAVSANPAFVTPLQGMAQGFDHFIVLHGPPAKRATSINTAPADPWLRSSVRVATADRVTAAALHWIAGHSSGPAPFFLYVHYFDPHAAYFPPTKYAARFGVAPDHPLFGAAQWPLLLAPEAPASAEDLATLVALYDGEIAFTDAAIGRLLEGIRARSTRPTMVVLTGDHGEEFGDHGGVQHGRTLWDELLRVPLVVAGPGIPHGSVVTAPVSLVSLWPTLAELTDVRPPTPTRPDAPSLAGLLRGTAPPRAPQRLFADLEARFPRDRLVHRHAVVFGSWKLTVGADRRANLYDLETDPGEHRDLVAAEHGRERLLQTFLRVHNTAASAARAAVPPATITLTPERRDRLKALGYLR